MFRFFNHYIRLPTLVLASLEAALIFLLLLALTMLHLEVTGIEEFSGPFHLIDLLGICFSLVFLLAAVGFYNRDAVFQLGVLLQRSVIFLFIVVFLGFVAWLVDDFASNIDISDDVSLISLATILSFLTILALRITFISFPKFDIFKRRVLVIGRGALGYRVRTFLAGDGSTTLQEVGYLSLEDYDQNHEWNGNDKSEDTHAPADLIELAREHKADEIVIASREWRGMPVWQLLECKMAGIHVADYLSFWERETGQIDMDEVKPSWLALSDGFRASETRQIIKRAFDIFVSLLILILTFPILLITALLIKVESPGPVFYRQARVGLHGKNFRVTKFRSMRDDAEKDGIPQWATAVDPRVTRVGHFIRKSRIDEIPQIFNVLFGQMSFVGPRPEREFFIKDLEKKIPLYSIRHNVRPGITGWAQVNYPYGASVEDSKNKLAYDLYYVKNGGLFLDIVILLQTARVVLSGDGAR